MSESAESDIQVHTLALRVNSYALGRRQPRPSSLLHGLWAEQRCPREASTGGAQWNRKNNRRETW